MKVKTNFKQMYLVDTMHYNKLTFKDDPSVAWIDRPMKPNIHIHNKHTPPPYTPPPPPPPTSALPAPLPQQPSPSQLPTAPLVPSSNANPFPSVLPVPSHATSHIQPSVDFLNQIYDKDDSEVNDWMNSEQQNVKDYRDDPNIPWVKQKTTKDTDAILKQKEETKVESSQPQSTESMQIDVPSNQIVKNNLNSAKSAANTSKTPHITYSKPIKSLLSLTNTSQIQKLPQAMEISSLDYTNPPSLQYTQPSALQYIQSPSIDYTQPSALQYTHPSSLQYTQPSALQYTQPSSLQYTQPSALQYSQPSSLQYTQPPALQYTQPSQLQYTQPSALQYTQPSQLQYTQPSALQYTQPSPLHYSQPSALQYTHPSPLNSTDTKRSLPQLKQENRCIECDDDIAVREYKDYDTIKNDAIVTFKCTLCDTNFKKKSALLRHNKDFHDAFYQSEKGVKRKSTNMSLNNKRFKSARGDKRKMNSISPPNKKANTKI